MITSLKEYRKKIKKKKTIIVAIQLFILVSFILCWELLTKADILNGFLLSSPSRIFSLLLEMSRNGELSNHIIISTKEMMIALLLSSTIGIMIASILYLFPSVYRILDPYLVVLNAIPKTALGPILIIYLGTGEKGIIGVSITFSIIITIISSLSTFKNVDTDLIKMMNVLGANRFQILFKIVYPSSLSGLLSIIKVNIGLSWVGVIVGEYLVSRSGIGYLIMYGGQTFKLDLVMMGIIILSVITLLLDLVVVLFQKAIKKKLRITS